MLQSLMAGNNAMKGIPAPSFIILATGFPFFITNNHIFHIRE
jgi:hypothetical protein